jgi:hypothetical protein
MPLYTYSSSGTLNRVPKIDLIEAGITEADIETIVWENISKLLGPDVFPVARQAKLDDSRRMDILCLHRSGQVVIIELKRDGDRKQLSQILEYAGWVHCHADLQSIGNLYIRDEEHKGFVAFINDWQSFTNTRHLVEIQKNEPQLFLIAGRFEERTEDAIEYLRKTGAQIETMELTFYEETFSGNLSLHVKSSITLENKNLPSIFDFTEEIAEPAPSSVSKKNVLENAIERRRPWKDFFLTFVAENILQIGDEFEITRNGKSSKLRLLASGNFISIDTGIVYSSPSAAAVGILGTKAANGWDCLRTSGSNTSLDELRKDYLRKISVA